MKTLHELFEDGIKDIYNAEKQLVKALPKMAKMAKNPRLKQGFENHLRETEAHAQRIEMACRTLGMKPSGMVCKGMKGLIDEASEHMSGLKPGASTDAELIALAQKVEHYEIGTYGTLCTWAELMGHTEALGLLKNNLSDEERTDQLLTQVATSEVNQMAARENKQSMTEGANGRAKRGGRRTSGQTAGRSSGRKTTRSTTGRSASGRTTTKRTSGRATGRAKATTTRGRSTTSRTKTVGRRKATAN